MSDIFDFNGDYNNPSQNNEHTQSRNEYWAKKNERRQQLNAEYQQDLDRYSVNISQEDYNIIKDAIANAEVPEDEAYRWACAMELNKQYNMPVAYAYQNLEQINAAKWGDRFNFTPKTNFKAIVDSGRLGVNTLKMGRLGSKIMKAEMVGKTDYNNYLAGKVETLDDMMAEYAALDQESASLTDLEDRNFAIEALKFAAQSAPYTGYVAGVGLLGGLLSGGAGTAAAFAVSMDNAAGLEYMRLRKAGSDIGDAAGFAILSGGLQALVETSLGNVAGALGKKSLGDLASQAVKNKITGNVFKRLAYNGTFKDLALRMGKEWLKENAEEGLEEVVQDLIEKGTDALAAELGGYEIEGLDAQTIARDAWENFRGGVMGSLILGLPASAIKGKADIKEFVNVRKLAEVTPSQETFNKFTDDSTLWEGMSEEEKKSAQRTTWENAQARVDAAVTAEAKQIAEGRDAAEGAEEAPVENEDGTTEANPVARNEYGKLDVDDEVYKDSEGNVTGGTYWAGDPNKSENNRYGYIKYSQDADGNITIDDFKMTDGREGLREELFDQFAREHPDVKIEWNPAAAEWQEAKQALIDANPSGAKNGLNYYTTEELTSGNIEARKRVAEELRKNIHNVKKNANGTYTRTELSNKQIAAGVTLIESAARRMGMSLNDYINKTFGNQIFGTREEFAQASLAQGEDVNTKAGGMLQGVAQSNWKDVGQQIKAVIYAGENADFSTWAHEMAHVYQNQLEGDLKTEAENAFNVQGGDWINSTYTFKDGRTMSSAEAFAYGFQDWLETGKAENEQMRNIFQKFAEFIADCYNRLKKHLDFTPEIVDVFNKLLDGDDTIMSKALKAAQEQDNEYRASLKRQAEEKKAQQEAEKEQSKKQAEAEREEASEGTDFTEEKSAEAQQAEAENKISEVTNETQKTDNAIDNALQDLPLTDQEKNQISDTLKDDSSTIIEKAEATTEAAESVYDEEAPYDLFQDAGGLLSQLIGEPSIRRLAESEVRTRILLDLKHAEDMEAAGKDAGTIRRATGWEKINNEWKYETDDSVIDILDKANINKNLNTDPKSLIKDYQKTRRNLDQVLDAPGLFKLYPILKNVRVSFYDGLDAQKSRLSEDGILLNTRLLNKVTGPESIKASLVYEVQKLIYALEHNKTKSAVGENLDEYIAAADQLDREMRQAKLNVMAGLNYDKKAIQEKIENIMSKRGDEEARIVASRVLLNADQRNWKTLEQSKAEEDAKKKAQQSQVMHYQTIQDPDLLEKLNSEPTIKVYRAMQVIDGEYYPPMATVVEGKRVESAKAGDWIQADENPELAVPDIDKKTGKQKVDKDGNLKWKFVLDKGGKDSSGKPLTKIPAAYNPYWHTSRSPLNDQFSSAYKRPNLVTVQVEVPVSELTSGYRADRAKDAVGEMDWHSGPVSSQLAAAGKPRKVILSRYCKIDRVIPDSEVAQNIKDLLEGTDIAIPDNTITPSLKAELEKIGVKVEETEDVRDYNKDLEEATKKAQELLSNYKQKTLFQDELDNEYEEAVRAGDTEKAKQMLQEEAERKGYNLSSDYQGTSAFNGAAPYRNGYYSTKEERLEAVKNEEFEDTATLGDYAYDNADPLGFEFLIEDPRSYRAADEKRKEAIDNLRKAVSEARSGKKNVTIKMYRSVPADIKEGSFRNGDWITPSKSYAEDNADVHGWEAGEYRIIEQDVDLEHIWWDGNDIAEWGYDDEKEAVYKNTENNRKLFEVTYDEDGNLIPLSQRFDDSNPSILYQIAGEIGAENLDNSEVQEGTNRMQNLTIAKQMVAEGKDAKNIRLATGWEKGDDGYWRWEFADDYHLKNIKATNEKLERYEKELKEAENNLKAFTENKEKAEHKIKDMVKRGLLPEGTTYETELEKAQEKVHIAQMLLQYDNLLDVEKALKRLIERGIDPTDFWNDMGESFYLPQLIDNPELFRAYPELEKVTIAFARKDVDNHMGGYNPEENSITIFPAGAKTYTDFLSVLAHEVQHAIQYIEGFAKGGSTEQFKPRIRTKDEVINKDLQWAENLEDSYPDKKAEMQKIKSLMLDGNRSQAWEKIRALQKEAIEKDDRDYARYIDEYGYKLDKIQRNIIEEDIESPEQQYHRLAGEVEARNVQKRMNFTPEQRRNILLAATEDVAPEDRIILFQEVYHGSGADFDKFDTENYGLSGEGSMSFGYGTYVTDSEDIARDYAERQRPKGLDGWNYKGKPINSYPNSFDLKEVVAFLSRGEWSKEEAIKEITELKESYEKSGSKEITTTGRIDDLNKLLNILNDKDFSVDDFDLNGKTRLYTVEIPDDGYLDWEQPVTQEMLKNIAPVYAEEMYKRWLNDSEWQDGFTYTEQQKQGIRKSFEEELYRELEVDPTYNGAQLYNYIRRKLEYYDKENGARLTSKLLYNAGYAGIKYPAGTIHGNGNGAYNYVIFNDDDAKIVDKLLFQTNAELMDEAKTFESWQDFMEYCETFHADDEVSPIPGDADAKWYQTFWETSNGVKTEEEKRKEEAQAKNKKDTQLPLAVDALFSTFIRTDPQMVDSFLQAVADLDAIDLDSEEWQHVEDEEGAKQRERIEQLKDFINVTLSDYNWQTAMRRVQGGHEISEGLRKRLIGEMVDNFKTRDFRALYAEVMGDEQYAVAPEDSITATLNKKIKKYHDIVKPNDDISRWSPERRKQLAEQLANRELAEKIRRGDLKLDDELDAYIKSLNKQIKEKQKQYDELETETKADYQRIADKERRDLLKLHEQLLLARGKLKKRNAEIERKIKKGLKITEKYRYGTENANADYDEIFRKYSDLRNSIEITADVQAALDRQEQLAGIRDDLNAKQKEKNLTAEVKKMRIQLVKRAMRRVPFNRVDYESARTVIAIQRMLEPNLLGGVNRFIGIDSPYLRGVISQIVTDSDYKEAIMHYLSKNSKASQAFADFKKKLEELKSIKDFDSWTARDRKNAIRYLPKENWVRDLNLKQLAKEREESIDLDIGMEEYSKPVYDEKTGEPKTYKDKDGQEHNVTETAFRLQYDEELGRLVQDAVGADMFDKIVNMPFSEWTTEDLETLAQRIDEIYTEGRDLKAAKDEAKKREAAAIRKRIEDAIKETGITINDDDTPEEKERKQKQIDKILGMSSDLKGTEAAKAKGPLAKLNRLLHSYADMNVLRFARMLDGQSEGENVFMLYRKEDECYNKKQRSMNARAEKVYAVMKENGITEGDLAKTVEAVGTEFSVDELLYFLAADKDYEEDEKKLAKGLYGLDANDDYAATSRNALMFGNVLSDMFSQEEKESWVQKDKDMLDALQNDTLTQEQKEQQAAGFLDTKPGTSLYIAACHAKYEAILAAANNYLSTHPELKALMDVIEADYASQFDRMNEVSINEFNQPVHRVKAYVPLVRRESNGDTNENQVREDLLGAAGVGKQWADRGMTQRRVNISPLNQKPVQTGLFRTWGDSIERTEHFIAYAPYVRQLNAVYKSRDAAYTRRFIESRYGKGAIEYLDAYINEVANPNAGRIRERGAEWLHVLRGKTAPAYLGWKASAIIKQGLTSPWPYMQFVNPAEYVAAAMKFTFNPEMREAIKDKSVFMKMRRMDPVNDLIDEMADSAKTKLDRGWSNFSKIGMQGLEMIDWACVAPGWLACYEKKYNQLQNASNARYEAKMAELKERNMYAEVGTSEYLTPQQMEAQARKELAEDIEAEAVRYADDCTRQCQPSNRVTDLAPLFKNSSEAMKAFLQFQTSLNVIWQNIRYDMPYAVKNKEFTRIAGTVIGYICAGIFMNSVMEGLGGDDDDDETQALRNLIYYSTTQFTDAIPIMGSEITNFMDKAITGKRAYSQSGTDMTPSATKLLNALQKATSGDWEKAAAMTAEGLGLLMGAPVSGAKEINKLLGKPLDNGDVNLARGISDVYGIAGDIIDE